MTHRWQITAHTGRAVALCAACGATLTAPIDDALNLSDAGACAPVPQSHRWQVSAVAGASGAYAAFAGCVQCGALSYSPILEASFGHPASRLDLRGDCREAAPA